MKKLKFIILGIMVIFLSSAVTGCSSYQEKGRKAYEKQDYEKAMKAWGKTNYWGIYSIEDEWHYAQLLEDNNLEQESHEERVKAYNTLMSYDVIQEKLMQRDRKVYEEMIKWGAAEIKKQNANNHKTWLKENHFFELSKIEKGVYYMMEVGDNQDAMETLGYIPEYRLFPGGDLKEVINDSVNGTYNWSLESDTHATFHKFDAWSNTLIQGDLYLEDDDSLSMYVEGDYVGKLYMRYRVKE